MFCKNCGTENVDGAKFCRACGAPQEQAAPAANTGYNAKSGYAPNAGYTPNQGYTPNRAPVRRNAAPAQTNIMGLIPAIAGGVALICMFLPWYVISVFGYSDSLSLFEAAFDFGSWEGGFYYVLLTVLSLGCIAAAAFSVVACLKKIPVGKFVAIGGAVAALLTLFVWKGCAGAAMAQLAEYAKAGVAFYLYIAAMVASGVVSFLNEKK